ncbi:hypothetical protein BJI67_02335 [Acidihalobacter aeolianus]|uniref:TonB-dependent receptor-like beta-barrel domain-containing protein n=1 Tax=Acidihalobacter aeolianus TaxID=2792603 RepID=A0A1D8KBN0_9GAMM|nr:hypothetical protein BJI67_02335 [Acidihalobacter aeolianus]
MPAAGKVLATSLVVSAAALSGRAMAATPYISIPTVTVNQFDLTNPILGAQTLGPSQVAKYGLKTSNTADILDGILGGSVFKTGGVSGFPVVHGLMDDQLHVSYGGMQLNSACPNHMNPILSYLFPSQVGAVTAYTGIVPVSVDGNSIGASVVVHPAPPKFAMPGKTRVSGSVGGYYRSNGSATGGHLAASIANDAFSMKYSGDVSHASDYKAGGDFHPSGPAAMGRSSIGGDVVGSSAYSTSNQQIQFAYRHGSQLADLSVNLQDIPYEYYPNQRMDMVENKSTLIHFNYRDRFDWGNVKLHLYHQDIHHTMDFGSDKQYMYGTTSGMPMKSHGHIDGAKLDGTIHLDSANLLRTGLLFHSFRLNDYWPPSGTGMMAPNTFDNINDGHSNRYDAYVEWRGQWSSQWSTLMGVRSDTVEQNAGEVHGYNMMYNMQAAAFNAQPHKKTDRNWDWSLQAKFQPTAMQKYTFGVMRQERSPNLYQRYTWSSMPMVAVMNNLVGDGNGYVGNLNLKPEVAYTAVLSGEWASINHGLWKIRADAYLTQIHDYIGEQCAPGTTCQAGKFNVLQYVNQQARMSGADASGKVLLAQTRTAGEFFLNGKLSYIHARNTETHDGLFGIAPWQGKVELAQNTAHWDNAVDVQFVGAKTNVSSIQSEPQTKGYTIVNLHAAYKTGNVTIRAGIDNVFNRLYYNPQNGVYVGQGMTMMLNGIPAGITVPGPGRSFNIGFDAHFA